MNRIIFPFILTLLMLQACGGFKQIEKKTRLTTTPSKVGLFVNTQTDPYLIPVSFTLNIPRGYVPSCGQLTYTPRLVSQDSQYMLTPIVITGKDYNKIEERLEFLGYRQPSTDNAQHYEASRDSMKIPVQTQIPFQLWMTQARLISTVTLEACDREENLYDQILSEGVNYIPVSPGPVLTKLVQKEITKKEEGIARFYYPVNGYKVDPALHNNSEQLSLMSGLIQKIMTDTLLHLNKVIITGVCSPDGPYTYNESLARKRAEFIREYLTETDHLPSDKIEANYIAEDWAGLRKLISESTMPGMEQLLPILDGPYGDDQREAMLQKSPLYNYIKQNFYPQLRKVIYEVFYTSHEWVEEIVPE